MAVVDRESTLISNTTASPSVSNSPPRNGSNVRSVHDVIATAADDTQASIGRFVRVPSNAVVTKVLLSAADATTAGAIDIGVYQTEENGGAVVDADFFASAVDLSSGPYSNLDVTFESGQYTYAESVMPLWQALGLSADPQRDYDIAYTIATTFNGGPTSIRLAVEYVQ